MNFARYSKSSLLWNGRNPFAPKYSGSTSNSRLLKLFLCKSVTDFTLLFSTAPDATDAAVMPPPTTKSRFPFNVPSGSNTFIDSLVFTRPFPPSFTMNAFNFSGTTASFLAQHTTTCAATNSFPPFVFANIPPRFNNPGYSSFASIFLKFTTSSFTIGTDFKIPPSSSL